MTILKDTILYAIMLALALSTLWIKPVHAIEGDKQIHLLFGALMGASGTIIKDRQTGMLLGCGLGLLKEMSDYGKPRHKVEIMDFAYTCGGAILAAEGIHRFKLRAKRKGVVVEWMAEF